MAKRKETFHNLLDVCIELEKNTEISGNSGEMFRYLLRDYFFKNETEENKGFHHFFQNFMIPNIIDGQEKLINIDISKLTSLIDGSSINDSLSGKIMLSEKYLKAFYSHHPPSFKQMPNDIQQEIIQQIKQKNMVIINAFSKMQKDFLLDKNRKVITLIALILKNIFRLSGIEFKKLDQPANEIINKIFHNTDSVFTGSEIQIKELNDDMKVKQLIKSFYKVKNFNDITELTSLYKQELKRFINRTIYAYK